MKKHTGFLRLWLGILLGILLTGCATPNSYVIPITKFKEGSDAVIIAAKTEYLDLNKPGRDLYFDSVLDSSKKIEMPNLNSQKIEDRTIGTPIISKKVLEEKVAILDLMSKHGQLLLALAKSEDAANAKEAIISAGTAAQTISKLTTQASKQSPYLAYAAMVGELVKVSKEIRTEKQINKAIIDANEKIELAIELLSRDAKILQDLRSDELWLKYKRDINKYNALALEETLREEKLKAIAAVKNSANAVERAVLPSEFLIALGAMKDAHESLVDYALSSKSAKNFSDLFLAMNVFSDRVDSIGKAALLIKTQNDED